MREHEESFADQLGRYLVRAGFTQQELANKIGMHRNTVVKWINRTSRPTSQGQVLRIADELSLLKEERRELIQAAGFVLERWPTEIWTVPQQRDMFFTGRDTVFQSLRELLVPGSTTALTQALSGLGGIGKTHTAVEYAYRFHQDYEAVLWLQGDSWEILVSACMKLADELGLPEQKEAGQVVEEVRRWLRKHHHWLLILDNVENPQEILPKFVPTGHQGCVLVTTRVHRIEPLAQSQMLSTMSEQEGVIFLLRRTARIASKAGLAFSSPEQYDEAKHIWQLLDGLPLALDQAGAYILETGCSFSTYRDYYTRRQDELLLRRGKRFIGHEASVATTFSLAFEQVKARNTTAAGILQVCSLLFGEVIPEEFFQEGAEHLGLHLATERESWDLAMGVLQDYSLVQRNSNTKSLTIHQLVQTVLLDTTQASEQELWMKHIIAAMNRVFPHAEPTTWRRCERLLPQALACVNCMQSREILNADLATLLLKIADYLDQLEQYIEAEPLYQRSLQIWEQIRDARRRDYSLRNPDIYNVALLRCSLGNLYNKLGKYDEAESIYYEALYSVDWFLGLNHPFIACVFYGLGCLYRDQGKYDRAESCYHEALHIWKRLDSNYPEVATAFLGLANLYRDQGKYDRAESCYHETLHIWEQVLEPDHPNLAYPLTGLAELYDNQGKYVDAEPLYHRALIIRENTLRLEHPMTINTRKRYILLLREMGRYDEVARLEAPQTEQIKTQEKYEA